VRRLSVRHERFALIAPFRIARGVKTAADVVVVTIEADGRSGRGEGVPYPRYGESVDTAMAAIEAVRGAIEAGADRADLIALMPAGAARAAVDGALWDLEGGLTPPPALISALTIGIDTPGAMAAAAAKASAAPLLKIKVDRDDPAARLRAVRSVAPDARLIVDPNESWDRATMVAMASVLTQLRVDLLEQPVPAGEDAWLEGFNAGVPVCADESFHGVDDLDAVARLYACVNVKLDKTGGLTAALALIPAIRERGLGLMTGCMICSSLSIAPALQVAMRSDFVDLDGPLWLASDRAGGVRDRGGILQPPAQGFWG
jgi:L-alanine-DL-glutamate epimerase-like enolase superfamily enzyme